MKSPTPNTLYFIIALFTVTLLLPACKKENSANNNHPYAGTYHIQNQANGYSLKYVYNGFYHGITVSTPDSMLLIAGPATGQYYIISKQNIDKYLDIDNQCCTFIQANDFNNSNSQLFTVEPIYDGATRYYIKSVKDPMQLLSSYRQLGSYSSTFFNVLNTTENGGQTLAQIWILEKL